MTRDELVKTEKQITLTTLACNGKRIITAYVIIPMNDEIIEIVVGTRQEIEAYSHTFATCGISLDRKVPLESLNGRAEYTIAID